MKGNINSHMIVLAREARSLNQLELAGRIHMSATNLSKIERGDIGISEEVLEAIAEITSFPPHFFQQEGKIVPANLGYRRRQNVSQKLLLPINARTNIIRRHVQFLTQSLRIDPPVLPSFTASDYEEARSIASKLRKCWDLPPGPVDSLTSLLELKGIAVMSFDFGTERVDSRSLFTDEKHPIVFLNKKLLGDRQRFSLAYELGQLVMHSFTDIAVHRDIGHEANLFAAEFLLPAQEIKKDFKRGVSLALLGELKKKWKVSMIALLYRADDLALVSPNQKRYLLQQFNQQQIRRREPVELDVPAEQPSLIRKWIADYRAATGLGFLEISALLCLHIDEFLELYS
ncbi:MAG: ImmA/IrrE family metallo-endopeptidase [Flavisolibacter sp.]